MGSVVARSVGLRSIRSAPARLAALAALGLVLALVATGCGETASARSKIASSSSEFWGEGTPAAALPSNGENDAGQAGVITYKFTTVTKTITRRVAGVEDALRMCPVQGQGSFSDDFGAPRYAGGFHLHAGNDIFAPRGTPVVAPFDGIAHATPNRLGGLAVTVYGTKGYVYNAHLVAYGKLGSVVTGQVVGFVGNTGDALGGATHDHFEWHPATRPAVLHVSPFGVATVGTAVDPYPYLRAACSA